MVHFLLSLRVFRACHESTSGALTIDRFGFAVWALGRDDDRVALGRDLESRFDASGLTGRHRHVFLEGSQPYKCNGQTIFARSEVVDREITWSVRYGGNDFRLELDPGTLQESIVGIHGTPGDDALVNLGWTGAVSNVHASANASSFSRPVVRGMRTPPLD